MTEHGTVTLALIDSMRELLVLTIAGLFALRLDRKQDWRVCRKVMCVFTRRRPEDRGVSEAEEGQRELSCDEDYGDVIA